MFRKNISIDENILRKNKIPLLFTDPDWIKLFGDSDNKRIQELKDELIQLVTRENVLKSYSEKIQRKKTKYMKLILDVSDSVNNKDNKNKAIGIELLDEYKEEILKINEEIEDITFQLESIPKEIREANHKLLTATVEYGYDELKHKEKIFNKHVIEIDELRERLRSLLDTKHDYEEWINETYTFLHGILGSEVIEKIDREKLK